MLLRINSEAPQTLCFFVFFVPLWLKNSLLQPDLKATIAAVETLDACLGRIMKALHAAGGTLRLHARAHPRDVVDGVADEVVVEWPHRFLAGAEFDECVFHELDVLTAGLHVLSGERPGGLDRWTSSPSQNP